MAVDASQIGVTGPNGRLGSELIRRGCLPIPADVTDYMALHQAIRAVDPEVIVHCAAYTDVDGCELSPVQAARVNTGGTFGLCEVFPRRVVYISTDYIFDGARGPYAEGAPACPISVYGWSKLGGEIVVRNRHNPGDLIVRTTVLFDNHSQNFVTDVVRNLAAGETVALPQALYGSPTYVPHLVDGILAAIDRGVSGVVNLAGWRVLSRWQFGVFIAEAFGYDAGLIAEGMVTGRAPRPLKAGLQMHKACTLGLPIRDPLNGLREMAATMQQKANIHELETVETR